MIDINIIRDKYASMTDEQLIHLAKEGSKDLTDEALLILKQEFARRNLSTGAFEPVEKEQSDLEEREPVPGFYNPATHTDDIMLEDIIHQLKISPAKTSWEKIKTSCLHP